MYTGIWRSGSSIDLANNADASHLPAEGKLRRAQTAQTRRRSRRKNNDGCNVSAVSKEPLRIVHSVPLHHLTQRGDEWVSRRGVFSRRNYGSPERLLAPTAGDANQCRQFRVEGTTTDCDVQCEEAEIVASGIAPVLENPEIQTRWYFKYFLGKVHHNYAGIDDDKNVFFLSVLVDVNGSTCRAILWKRTGAQKISFPSPNRTMTAKQILSHFPRMDKLERGPKEIFNPDIQKDLLLLEEQEGSVNFKFGILYAKPGQQTDDEMLSNDDCSEEFEEFLQLLGKRVELKGWDRYRGGLDVKADMTGSESVYTVYEGHEVMFHVSTLLPLSADKQQVERKRHIGNDIVNIVFVDDPSQVLTFEPSLIKSQFTHVFAVVTWLPDAKSYQLAIFSEMTVPLFGPTLPDPAIFTDPQEFREFLLVKLINGEKATFNTPLFAQKRERTLDLLMKDMYADVGGDVKDSMLSRNSLTDMMEKPTRSSRRKEEARQIEFIRIGQALKLETIVKGDAPTSLATTGLYKRAPWEPQCILSSLPSDILCGDSWDENLIVATPNGVILFADQLHDQMEQQQADHQCIIENGINVRQMNVLEAHDLLLIRADKGRDGKMYVFRLSDFTTLVVPKTKQNLKEHRLDKTKGCHLFAVNGPKRSHLRVVAAMGRRIIVLQWRYSAAWTAWCSSTDTNIIDGFQYINEITVNEPPCLMTLLDANQPTTMDNVICIGYRHQFDMISERTGQILNTCVIDGQRVSLVDAVIVPDDQHDHLLFCYNNTCHWHSIRGCSSQPDFHWSVEPKKVVNAFPFVMAFSPDQLEIRLLINGNLIATLMLPKLLLITAKDDLLFVTTSPEVEESGNPDSPEPGAEHLVRPLRLFSISKRTLCGNSSRMPRLIAVPSTNKRPTNVGNRLIVPDFESTTSSRSCTSSPTATNSITEFPK